MIFDFGKLMKIISGKDKYTFGNKIAFLRIVNLDKKYIHYDRMT